MMREVQILQAIDHENIIKLVETFIEDEKTLYLVMEYFPGKELFEAILEQTNGAFAEENAKPIFMQVCKGLVYLHKNNIIHRDIKPENILVVDNGPSSTPVVKILDFGLSKSIKSLTPPKTFVGTACYLAPEVEFSRQSPHPYGKEVDCWSLGAVLYVMLVARFPEFTQDATKKQSYTVVFKDSVWGKISSEAKSLIRGLMNEDPMSRLTAEQALAHQWTSFDVEMGQLSDEVPSDSENSRRNKCVDFSFLNNDADTCSGSLNSEQQSPNYEQQSPKTKVHRSWASMMESETSMESITHMESITRSIDSTDSDVGQASCGIESLQSTSQPSPSFTHPSKLQIIPVPTPLTFPLSTSPDQDTENKVSHAIGVGQIIHYQNNISNLFKNLLLAYPQNPNLYSKLRQGAILCREQMRENNALLNKMERIATSVLEIFSDLELAVEENEPDLASDFFSSLRGWVDDLSKGIKDVQEKQRDSTMKVHVLMEQTVQAGGIEMEPTPPVYAQNTESSQNADAQAMLGREEHKETAQHISNEIFLNAGLKEDELIDMLIPNIKKISEGVQITSSPLNHLTACEQPGSFAYNIESAVLQMLGDLYRIDQMLDQLASFWANTKVILDVMLLKADHVEKFVKFSSKPKLYERFFQRLTEYKFFWRSLQRLCQQLMRQPTGSTVAAAYSFLEESSSLSNFAK